MTLKILSKKEIFKGKFKSLWQTDFLDKKGNERVWEWIHKKDCVQILPITSEGNIVFIKNYRIPVERYTYELSVGEIDEEDESPLEAAKRELLEETGFTAEKFIPLRSFANSAGNMPARVYPFVAVNATRVNNNTGDETEDIEVIEIPASKIYEFYESCPDDCDFNIRILALYEIAKRKRII